MNVYWVLLLSLFVAQDNGVTVSTSIWIALVVIMFLKAVVTLIEEQKKGNK